MKRLVLGVTGRMAAGKDTACGILRELGIDEIDVDRIGHMVLDEKTAEVTALFGEQVLNGTEVDRSALGRLVFSDPGALSRLEGVLHPAMRERVAECLERVPRHVVINAAVLRRMGLDALCDGVLFVDAPDTVLAERAMARSHLTREEAFSRLQRQKTVNHHPESAEVLIENDSSPEDFRRKMLSFAESFFGEGPYGTATGTKWPQGDVYPEPGQ